MSNTIVYSPHAVFSDVDMLNGQTVLHSYPRHFHDSFGLALIHSGVELCWSRGAEHVFNAGDLVLFNAGEIHDGRPKDAQGWTYDMAYFSHEMICDLLEQPDCWFDPISIRDFTTFALAKKVLREAHVMDPAAAEELMIELLTRLVYRRKVHDADKSTIPLVRDFIDAHMAQPIPGQLLSSVSGLSIEHTIRSFRSCYGITPHFYHQVRRSESARRLLRGRLTVAEISYDLGFYDQSHFTKWFHKTQGVTPTVFRSSL